MIFTTDSMGFHRKRLGDSSFIRRGLIGVAVFYLGLFLILPLVVIFYNAFEKGIMAYGSAIWQEDVWSAIRLTLLTVFVAVPLNVIFGVSAAWAISKYAFRGKNLLITIIDLPFSVSPVISGMIFILLFGTQSYLGSWFVGHGFPIIFAMPGIVLATVFITLPFVARELIPLMQSQGIESEEAALTLGAGGWKTFFWVTLPNIRWGLIYGVVLCVTRAVGEFGAVSVVSGHIRGKTITMPLEVEILYNEYNFTAAFAVASLMAFTSLITLLLKKLVEWKTKQICVEEK